MKHFRRQLAAAFALAALSFGACKGRDHSKSSDDAYMSENALASGETDSKESPPRADFGRMAAVTDTRKIIHTGAINIVVTTYDDASAKIDELVKASGGYVDSTQVSHSEGQVSSAEIVLRIPASTFGDLLPKLRELGEVTAERTDSSDITAEYVDLSARRSAAAALEKRLLELAADRTGTVAEVLEVERELARVRGDIEHYDGQIRMWDDQVTLSSLTIMLSTRQPEIAAPAAPGFRHDASGAFDRSMGALQSAGKGLLLALIALLPWLPLFIPGFLIGRRYVRRLRAALPKAVAYAYPEPFPRPVSPDQRPPEAPSPP